MRCCLIVTLSSSLLNASTGPVAHPVRQGDASAVGRAWEFMETGMSRGVPELLDHHQPLPILPELRTRVMAALPSEGELTPTPVGRVKLAAVDPVLKIYRRLGRVSLRVVDVLRACGLAWPGSPAHHTRGAQPHYGRRISGHHCPRTRP